VPGLLPDPQPGVQSLQVNCAMMSGASTQVPNLTVPLMLLLPPAVLCRMWPCAAAQAARAGRSAAAVLCAAPLPLLSCPALGR
jgi:hypothetical protein